MANESLSHNSPNNPGWLLILNGQSRSEMQETVIDSVCVTGGFFPARQFLNNHPEA